MPPVVLAAGSPDAELGAGSFRSATTVNTHGIKIARSSVRPKVRPVCTGETVLHARARIAREEASIEAGHSEKPQIYATPLRAGPAPSTPCRRDMPTVPDDPGSRVLP
jgi:hypothetical protein